MRWTDPRTGRRLSEQFDDQQDAADFLAHLRLAERRGVLAELDMGRRPLAEFTASGGSATPRCNLERSTLRTYAVVWNRHLLPRVGHLELRQLTPGAVARLRADLEADGVGPATIRKALGLLQAICRQAVEWEELRANPVKQIRKPPAPRQLAIRPLGPDAVEALRAAMGSGRDATLVSVLAYAGLRPEEALALQVRHVGQATLLVEQKNVGGEIAPGQKTARPPRSVELLDPLRRDLAAYLLARGRPGDQALLFPRADGAPWRETDYRNWRRRTFQARAQAAAWASAVPTTCATPSRRCCCTRVARWSTSPSSSATPSPPCRPTTRTSSPSCAASRRCRPPRRSRARVARARRRPAGDPPPPEAPA